MMKLRNTCGLCRRCSPPHVPTLSAQQDAPYSGIVVFGTSLSDPGNAFALRGGVNTPPDYDLNPLLIPNAPYMRGGHHFSNGATWVEQFARSLGLAGTVRPAYGSESPIATNYAVGAARSCDAPGDENVNLAIRSPRFSPAQTTSLRPTRYTRSRWEAMTCAMPIAAALGVPPGRRNISAGGAGGRTDLACAQEGIQTAIVTLQQAGAQHFLVWTVPNLGLTPAIRSLGPGAMQVATSSSTMFNTQMLLPTIPGTRSGICRHRHRGARRIHIAAANHREPGGYSG
jgi:phospholipase/lecithinase/hemolysin